MSTPSAASLSPQEIVSSGTTLTIPSGAVVSGVTVSQGGSVVGPGTIDGASTDAGSIAGVSLGLGTLAGLASLEILSGGVADSVNVVAGPVTGVPYGVVQVDAGGVASGMTLDGTGDVQTVLGRAIATVVGSGADDTVQSGGVASASLVTGGGVETVSSGGLASGATVLGGGLEVIVNGGSAAAVTVMSGGAAEFSPVISGAVSFAGGAVASTTLSSGVTILRGGSILYQDVEVASGGTLTLDAGALVTDVTVDAGGAVKGPGEIYGYGIVEGQVSGATFGGSSGYGAAPTLEIGGLASSVTVDSGTIQIDQDGTAVGDVIASGGEERVLLGGKVSGTLVQGGGLEILLDMGQPYATGTASDVTVASGGTVELLSAFVASGSTLPAAGVATAPTLFSGVTIDAGGEASYLGATVASGGTLRAATGDNLNGVLVSSGGAVIAASGAEVAQVTLLGGAVLALSSGGLVAYGLTVSSGATVTGAGGVVGFAGESIVDGGLSGVSVGVLSGLGGYVQSGYVELASGASAAQVRMLEGVLQIDSGAAASGDQVRQFSSETVLSGGATTGTVVSNGGFEIVAAGGVASGVTLLAGAVFSGAGTLAGANVDLGVVDGAALAGGLAVSSGGVASGVTVGSGGVETLLSQGSATGDTLASGGRLVISPGAAPGVAALTVRSGAVIDLALVSATSAAVNSAGQLVATSGGVTVATIALAGSAAGLNFAVRSDGAGGTDILLAPAAPVISAPAAATVGVGVATAIPGLALSDSAAAAGETFTVTLVDKTGALTVKGTGVKGSGSKSVTLTGALTQVNADLATLTDKEAMAVSDTITVTAADSAGDVIAPAKVAVTTNAKPVATAPATAALVKGAATPITGIGVAEAGNTAGETFTVTLSDSHGLLGATGSGVTGVGTKKLTLTGSLTQVNAALATLTETESAAGADTLKIAVKDSLGLSAAAISVKLTTTAAPSVAILAEAMAAFTAGSPAPLARVVDQASVGALPIILAAGRR